MIFTCNTKPLIESSSIAIVKSNVSQLHKKSCIVQVSATSNKLQLNVESPRILTEVAIDGHGEGEDTSIFIDSLKFRSLIATLTSEVLQLEFTDNALTIHSGHTVFSIPKVIDSTELSFTKPAQPSDTAITIDSDMWKFVQSNQEYAISPAYIHPVYTYAKVIKDGTVLTGDVDISLFTQSTHSPFMDCLLSSTIINLLSELPENSQAYSVGKSIVLTFNQESFSYRSEIQPVYESDDGVGSYMADAIQPLMIQGDNFATIKKDDLKNLIGQMIIFYSSAGSDSKRIAKDSMIKLIAKDDAVIVNNEFVNSSLDSTHHVDTPFEGTFNFTNFSKVISNMVDEEINVSPTMNDGEVSGFLFTDSHISAVIGVLETDED